MPKGKPKKDRESVSDCIFLTKIDETAGTATVLRYKLGDTLPDGTHFDLKQAHVVDAIAELVADGIPEDLLHFALPKIAQEVRAKLNAAGNGDVVTVSLNRVDYLKERAKRGRGAKSGDEGDETPAFEAAE